MQGTIDRTLLTIPPHTMLCNEAASHGAASHMESISGIGASEALFEAVFHQSSLGIVMAHPDLRILKVNSALCTMLGYSEAELVGQSVLTITHPDDRDETAAQATVLYATARLDLPIEKRYVRRDGSICWGRVTAMLVQDAAGQPLHSLALIEDITARKEIERQAASSSAYSRSLLEAAPDALITVDQMGRIVLANRQAEVLLGYARTELIGQPVELLLPERFHTLHLAHRAAYVQSPHTRPMGAGLALFARHRNGQEIPVEISLSPVSTGETMQVIAIIRDISERKQAEIERERLLASEQAARQWMTFLAEVGATLGQSLDIEMTTDRIATLCVPRLADIAVVDLIGEEQAIHRMAVAHRDPAQIERIWELHERYPFTATPEHPTTRVLREERIILIGDIPDSMMVEIARDEAHLAGLRAIGYRSALFVPLVARGRVIGALELLMAESGRRFTEADQAPARAFADRAALALDNAQLYQAQTQISAALKHSNDELERFALVASHDLQEPLRMVSSYTQLLQRRYRGKIDPEADEFIAFAVDGATHMQRLIKDLLTYARFSKQDRPFGFVELSAVLTRTTHLLAGTIARLGATVTWEALPTVWGDSSQLEQLFLNLIGNALKYHGPTAPQVSVTAVEEGNNWRIAVEDNGIGIAPEQHARIFEPFRRLHSREAYEGTGIGLAICQQIVERHGGRIWVDSQPGVGSTFFLTLPSRQPGSIHSRGRR